MVYSSLTIEVDEKTETLLFSSDDDLFTIALDFVVQHSLALGEGCTSSNCAAKKLSDVMGDRLFMIGGSSSIEAVDNMISNNLEEHINFLQQME